MELDDLCERIRRGRYPAVADEFAIQDAIADALDGVQFDREVHLSRRDRVDFMVGRCAIEVKTAGAAASVLRQLFRYAESPLVESLVLVTTHPGHAQRMPQAVAGVPLRVVSLWLGL